MSKIFAIGMSKTGTTSLAKALDLLGYDVYRVVHGTTWPDDFDAAVHEWVAGHFEELDRRYPGSQFICTVRERHAWLRSIKRHRIHGILADEHWDTAWQRRVNRALTGIENLTVGDEELLRVYNMHLVRVQRYFEYRPGDLLTIDICSSPNNWHQICRFLGKPIPDQPFPHEHQRNSWKDTVWKMSKHVRRHTKGLRRPFARAV